MLLYQCCLHVPKWSICSGTGWVFTSIRYTLCTGQLILRSFFILEFITDAELSPKSFFTFSLYSSQNLLFSAVLLLSWLWEPNRNRYVLLICFRVLWGSLFSMQCIMTTLSNTDVPALTSNHEFHCVNDLTFLFHAGQCSSYHYFISKYFSYLSCSHITHSG